MQPLSRRQFLGTSCVAAGTVLAGSSWLRASVLPGVETVAAPLLTGQERSSQPDIWALEVRYKPVRMINVDVTNPKTGQSSKTLVWYLAYRAVVRPSSNVPDELTGADRPIFVPECTFVSEDGGKLQTYADVVIPEAQQAIDKRERHDYRNSVEIVGPLPPVTPDRARAFNSLDGLATWVGIDAETDFFTVYLSGFSNGYQVKEGPDGKQIVLRRTLMQKFWRPSDRFDQSQDEIRLKGDPVWIYR